MTDYDKCSECNGDKDAYNSEKDEYRCSNRSCPNSPMNEELTYMV